MNQKTAEKQPDVAATPITRFYTLEQPLQWDGKEYEFAEITDLPKVKDRVKATKYVMDTIGTRDGDAILCATLAHVARFSNAAEMDEHGNVTGLIDGQKLPEDTLMELEYGDFTELVRRMSGKSLFTRKKKIS